MSAVTSRGMSAFAQSILKKYNNFGGRRETWEEVAFRQANAVVKPYLPELVDKIRVKIEERKIVPGGRYLYAAGRRFPQICNCFMFSAEDSREGWAKLMSDCTNALMTGGGIGVVYSKVRPKDSVINGLGGNSTGPCALMKMVNEAGRYIVQGGSRRSAIWAGLHWNHPDIYEFIGMKDWSKGVHQCRSEDFNFPAPMDGTNVSVILDDDFFEAFNDPSWSMTYKLGDVRYTVDHAWAVNVYWQAIHHMLRTGEPGFSVDVGDNSGENLRNACTELSSRDNGDVCNLLSLNMARIENMDEFAECLDLGVAFTTCGTVYGKLPIEEMYRVREKNRRLGVGLMGVHEWLLRRGKRYAPDTELGEWLELYKMSGSLANRWADKLGISRPVATRSIAPTGTISIIAETTSGIEPIFAVAYKRRYLDGAVWKAQYVLDPTAKKLVDDGIDPALIEDAFTLGEDVDRRIGFQAWMQKAVDHGIASTINLPSWGSSINNENTVTGFGNKMFKYLPELRGITAYPNGARNGQPLTRMGYYDAVKRGVGREFVDMSNEGSEDKERTEEIRKIMETSPYNSGNDESSFEKQAEIMREGSCRNGVCGE